MWCCVTPERVPKTKRIMDALAAGWPGGKVCVGEPPHWGPFVTWGQVWLAEKLIRKALAVGTPFFQIDNGFYRSVRTDGSAGYYRFLFSRPDPVVFADRKLMADRLAVNPGLDVLMKPWRRDGRHVLLAMPGLDFGRAFGVDVQGWSKSILRVLRSSTGRPVKVRSREASNPIEEDLADCWALVTHSSNVAVQAVLAGVPAFVEPTSMAAPLGNLDLDQIEDPVLADRREWWASLMCQQFSVEEMRSGLACQYLCAVALQEGVQLIQGSPGQVPRGSVPTHEARTPGRPIRA